MKPLIVAVLVLAMLGTGAAFALQYPYGGVVGQVSPDRVLAEREGAMLVPSEAFAPYTPEAQYPFGAVTEQVPPERALASRTEGSTLALVAYLPYTADAEYAPWCVCEQIAPERALAVREACRICVH